jgi:ubiquinone/menaquinone biosynthesis C-methylase UbiE
MKKLAKIILGIPLFVLAWFALARIVRHFYKFPMPEFLAPLIDNPFRRRFQPPDEMPLRHGIEPGMRVLEVGPGNGRYTAATARRVGEAGQVIAIDIEPKMIERLNQRVQAEDLRNVTGRVADVYALPFDDNWFDAAYMIAVIGEIPEPARAMRDIHRVLKPGGTLAFSEFFPDPDYPLAQTLVRQAASAGFRLKRQAGNWFSYTLVFEKN